MQAYWRKKRRRARQGAAESRRAACAAIAAPDNKIETIQRVLRHFLREIEGPDLGKS
jgi:hypothetical protein